MQMDSLSDQVLMKRIRSRDVDAFQVLYSRYEARIFNFVLRYAGDRALAEDLLQETFWRVWQAAATFQSERGEFRSWLYQVALNVVRTEMVHKRHTLEQAAADPHSSDPKAGPADDPGDRLVQQENTTLVAKALSGLTPPMREVVILKCFEGMKFSEIASVTGTPEGTLKSRFHRAVAELRRRLVTGER
ncbi:MAG: sigma-70 family RNA polymerase sigma factor [Acidobacteria bacterium]|nr:MAG: sigma-70 family RNA polymerase sigma factor [Acidobacteriota bacterium]